LACGRVAAGSPGESARRTRATEQTTSVERRRSGGAGTIAEQQNIPKQRIM
jgi:hypothetical protein